MENPRYARDKQLLCSIFPEIVRLLISHRLAPTIPETFVNLYHSSAFFQRLLHSQRCLLFFPRLLKFAGFYPRSNAFQLCLSSHPVMNNGKFTLLKLRLVCKSWCIALEQLRRFIAKAYLCQAVTKISASNKNKKEAWFMDHFANTHPPGLQHGRSPFIGDIVGLSWTKISENRQESKGNMPFQLLLSAYGHHVRYCNLLLRQNRTPESWFHVAILQILRHMPNLVMLKLWLGELDNGESTNFQNSLKDLPALVHLEILLVGSRLSDRIVSALVPKLPNVTTISTNLHENFSESGIQNIFPGASLQKLELLYLKFDDDGAAALKDDVRMHCIAKTLEEHSPFWNLSRLEIVFQGGIVSTWKDWQQYKINTPKLRWLKLFFPEWSCIDMAFLFRASLKYIDIELCAFTTLAEWTIGNGTAELKNIEQINFLSCEGVLDRNSNIWTMMPQLVTAKVKFAELDDTTGVRSRTNMWSRPVN